ncbi:sugar phosphate isomerase/epimerase family protein [Enterobacter cloacae complex sp. 2024EL-00232]|uniref:sugar phosphate isomerase/epimerase family protein n=1 Tax=unclassified Enterobacter cloacae complex TaxID=2757714 RepID=UPI001E3E3A3F|nr:TIM barrel protein [Enterobacter cloacae complex sp. 2021EL-01261]MCD2457969.1 sugar phosphate isomerase/epimerase [Enterobacter cloacae complex sp. 2021EL-01261]
MTTTLYPSAHIAELFFPLANDEDALLHVIQEIAGIGYYRGFETGIIQQSAIAKNIRTTAEQNQLNVTQWLTFELLKDNLNLSSLDHELREKSIHRACELVHLAAECGTTKLSLVSGSDPGDARREEAKKGFGEALVRIGEVVGQYPGMILQVEPLDRFAHKCQLIGPTDETVVWMKALRADCPKLYLAWDSAHVALNEEDLAESLALAAPLISQLHLANAILDPKALGYGDYHMKFGEPGFLTTEAAAHIIRTAMDLALPQELGPISLAVEMRTTEQDDLWDNERQCREFLQTAWRAALQ